jgi:diguanylate cyclase (GGDEF)-like protein/PAS domain S-box-containing protein
VAIAMFDREMRYIVASRRWLHDYGLGDRDLRGLSHYDVFPDIPERWRMIHRRGLNGEVVSAVEDRFDRADGTVRWLHWEVQPWYDGASQGGIILFTEDITDRKRAEELFRATFEFAPVGMIMTDATGSIVLINAEAERMFGYKHEELLNKKVDVLMPDRFRSDHPNHRARFLAAPHARPMGVGRELFGLRKDGSEFPTEIGLSPVKTDQGLFMLSAIVDITKRKQLILAKEKAEELATHDFLTGLPNRVLLLDRVSQALAMAKRKRRMIALLNLDIDDFKKVNDTYGHGIGDRLLVEVAARMKTSLRESDTVTRWGGDEFLLLAPEIESVAQIETLAAHLLEKLRQPFDFGKVTLPVTFSVGIALYPRDGTTAEVLISTSDRGLYIAKHRGKNCFAFAS